MSSPYINYFNFPAGLTFLNHGSLGPTPEPVMVAKEEAARRVSRNPLGFMTRELETELDIACQSIGKWIRADARDLVLVQNATLAMNAVANAIEFKPGDEILLNDHEYGAVIRIFRERAAETGANLVIARLPAKFDDPQELVDALFSHATGKTKVVVFSHITSPTSLILPAQLICDEARKRGILTCIDGPHALAMINVNLTQLNCDFYVGSCHKWLSAPCGTGMLYSRRKFQDKVFHPAISWGRSVSGQPDSWKDSFTWPGTFDPSPFMAIPAAISFLENNIGIKTYRDYTYELVRYAYDVITEFTGLETIYQRDSNWFGSMVTLPLPDTLGPPPKPPAQKHELQHQLQQQFGIEIPIIHFQNRMWIRVSCHLYNDRSQIDYLAKALKQLVA